MKWLCVWTRERENMCRAPENDSFQSSLCCVKRFSRISSDGHGSWITTKIWNKNTSLDAWLLQSVIRQCNTFDWTHLFRTCCCLVRTLVCIFSISLFCCCLSVFVCYFLLEYPVTNAIDSIREKLISVDISAFGVNFVFACLEWDGNLLANICTQYNVPLASHLFCRFL